MSGASACIAMTNAGAPRGAAGMETIKLVLSLCVFAAMIALCLVRRDWAGFGGLGCGVIGFVGWFFTRGQASFGERLGNGYIGAFFGICLGFAIGGVAELFWRVLQQH